MDKGLLIEFLEATQPETMAALSKLYKARRDATIFAKINADCVGKGGSLISTLKHGVSFEGGRKLDLFYPPPVSVQEKTVGAKWRQNIFSVAREIWASDNERVDHVLFVNGLAIATVDEAHSSTSGNCMKALTTAAATRGGKSKLKVEVEGEDRHSKNWRRRSDPRRQFRRIRESWRGVSDTARQLWIALPPLAEQKRIVAKVEELLSDVERLKKGAA